MDHSADTPGPAVSDAAPSLTRSTGVMFAATSVSRVTGYVRILALAYALGATQTVLFQGVSVRIADSYNLANSIPNMIYELVAGGIITSLFIPIFVEYLSKDDKKEAWRVAGLIGTVTAILLALIAALGMLFAYYLVRLQALTVSPRALVLATYFFRFFVIQIFFYGVGAVFTGILNSHRRFTAPAVAPIFNNLTVIVTVVFGYLPLARTNPDLALIVLAVGTTLGVVMMAVIQVPSLLRVGFRYIPVFDLKHPALIKMLRLGLPILGYVIASQVGVIVLFNLAFPFKGGVTAYQYSWQFFHLPYAIFAVSISTALFPELSERAAKENLDEFKKTLSLGIRTTGLMMIPATAALFILSGRVVQVFLQHGRFDLYAAQLTAPILSLFSLGLLSFSTYMLLTRVYFAMQDSTTPLITNVIGVPLHVTLNIALVGLVGVKGLALGHALTYTFTTLLLMWLLRRRIGRLGGRRIVVSLVKFVVAAVPSTAVMWAVARYLAIGQSFVAGVTVLAVALVAGAGVYTAAAWLLRVDELDYVKKLGRGLLATAGLGAR